MTLKAELGSWPVENAYEAHRFFLFANLQFERMRTSQQNFGSLALSSRYRLFLVNSLRCGLNFVIVRELSYGPGVVGKEYNGAGGNVERWVKRSEARLGKLDWTT